MMGRDRRAVVVGGIVLAGALVSTRAVPAVTSGVGSLRERAAVRQAALAEAHALLASRTALRDSLRSVLASLGTLAPKLLPGRSASDAGASLASALQGLAARYALRITRLDNMPDSTTGAVRETTARLELEGDIRGVTALLRDVETRLPVLTVRALAIATPDPGARGRAVERLRIVLTVTGWYLGETGS